jgi:hypothetical protein
MKRITKLIYSTFGVFTLACFSLAQQAPDAVPITVITTFDYPGTGNLTRPQKINDAGDILGQYVDTSMVTRGFVRFSNGTFSAPIVDPNDTCNYTAARGINNSGLICGEYASGADCTTVHGFFLMGNNFSDFDVPGFVSTSVGGVNNVGDFDGGVTDATGFSQGFVSLGGTITTFSIPGATFTYAYQLNSSNQLEGYYIDSSGIVHGYFRDADGTLYFPIDPPGSILTILFGNNDSNWMVGRYEDGVGTHGLLFVPPNGFFTFDYPGSSFTSLNGINAHGFICGRYTDASGIDHGILARVRAVPRPRPTPHPRPTQQFTKPVNQPKQP